MSEVREVRDLLAASAADLFRRHCPTEVIGQPWSPELWEVFERADLTEGASTAELGEVVRVAAQFAAPIPIGEDALARLILARAGLEARAGPLTVAEFFDGRAERVPFARCAVGIVAVGPEGVALLDPRDCRISEGQNLAGEPRDTVVPPPFDPVPPGVILRRWGALLRAIQIAGALERVLQLTVRHAGDRQQFGQPLRRFQAIGQQLAELAGETAAARAAANAAAEDPQIWKIAAAKVRCGEAAGRGATIAHQVHGAVGFTDEHVLHRFTLRLWSWRDEFGTEEEWASVLSGLLKENLWETLT
jgi:acyl-CoA dehydrogenase